MTDGPDEYANAPNPFRFDPPCSCHEPPMALGACIFSNAVDLAFDRYQARKAREAAGEPPS